MKSDAVYLHHILEAISRIERYVQGKTFEEFLRDELLQDGVIRQLSIIGEAARRVSEDLQRVYPEVPWKDIIGMRNIIVHDYFGVDLGEVWRTVQNDLQPLKAQIVRALEALEEGPCPS